MCPKKTEKDTSKAEAEDKKVKNLFGAQSGEGFEEEEFDDDEFDDDEYDFEEELDAVIETEIEHQTPEVVAKELLITYLETNAFAHPEPKRNESRHQATGRAIGEMYNTLLVEIFKTSR